MSEMGRRLTSTEHIVAEQGLLNLVLREGVVILKDGVDITLALITAAPRVNADYDKLHPPQVNKPIASPASMPAKKSTPPPVKVKGPTSRVRRTAKSEAGPPRPPKYKI